jgi:hypothetical protein
MIILNKSDLSSKPKARLKLQEYIPMFSKASGYSEDEIFYLILSAVRVNDWEIYSLGKHRGRIIYNLDITKVESWIKEKVSPNTVAIKTDEVDLLKLMVFSLAMPYKMLKGETRATQTEKTRRTKKRDFVQIFSDTFIGKIGEIAFKKFAKEKFGKDINLDWDISTDIRAFKTDIVGSKEIVSIKSTDTLESIWAEAPSPAKYGVFIKVAIPKDFFMKILAHISSLKKLLRYIEERLKKDDNISDLLKYVEQTAYEEEMTIKAYICGFFATSQDTLKYKGQDLPFLREVHEDKHLIEYNKLKHTVSDWEQFFSILLSK